MMNTGKDNRALPLDEVLQWLEKMALADGLLSDGEVAVIRDFANFAEFDADEIIKRLRRVEETVPKKVIAINPNFIKGIEFENCVFDYLHKSSDIKVLSRSADLKFGLGKNMDERSLCPDFCASQVVGKFTVKYWLECKYRTNFHNLYLPLSQLNRYIELQKEECPVFIVLGVGGTPSKPEKIFMAPVDELVNGSIGFIRRNKQELGLKLSLMDDFVIDLCEIESFVLKYFSIGL